MTLLARAARWAKERLDATTSVAGTYGRGVHSLDGVKAVPRLPGVFDQAMDSGALLTAREVDFAFTATELVLDSQAIEPAKGDWWRWQRPDGMHAYYDVQPNETGRTYDVSDNEGILWRVHMKLNRVEAPPV